jgi:soluble lytic murein transglycosylase
VLRLVYPAKHLAQVNAAAQERGVSPALMLALIRQESYFDASAVSPAGAMGLTQVIPSTGEGIAAELGITDFQQGDLLDPETNLRFGAYYLAGQLEGFGGNVGAALAAYNGGPGNASRWTETAGNDVDLLVETIDFDETRSYLELVLANLAFYRYAYGVSGPLSLPLE